MKRIKNENKDKKNNEKNKEKKTSKKKIFIIILIVLIIIGIISFCVYKKFFSNNQSDEMGVPVQSVAILTGAENTSQNRFLGLVVAENTVKVQKQEGRQIKQVYVEVGQPVKKGDKLFEYDTDETTTKIEQENLEVERMQNSITNSRKEIDAINAEKAANPGADHSEYNLQIQTLENEIRQTEYNIKSKNLEINKLKKQLKNVVITSEIDGIVQTINDSENQDNTNAIIDNSSEQDGSYMTIMQTGKYKVKGVINEQNMFSINPGDKVNVHSRVDESKIWTGTIENIDTSNPEKSSNSYVIVGDEDSMNTSSKYPFYITLDSIDGLMMGQHVFIEKSVGQEKTKQGLWIPKYFVVENNNDTYVWVSNSKDKIEKRKIKVGEKDETLEEYQILEGLTTDDYIATPSDDLKEGTPVTKFDFSMDNSMNMENGDFTEVTVDSNSEVINQDNVDIVYETTSTEEQPVEPSSKENV